MIVCRLIPLYETPFVGLHQAIPLIVALEYNLAVASMLSEQEATAIKLYHLKFRLILMAGTEKQWLMIANQVIKS